MQLPKEIAPNPLVGAICDIRVSADIEPGKLFSKIFPAVVDAFPETKPGKIPMEIKKSDPAKFKFAHDFVLHNENYSLGISDYSLTFENISEYSLWPNYFAFIKVQLAKIFATNIIKKIDRIGLRYISVFQEPLSQIIEYPPSYTIPGYEQHDFSFIRTTVKRNDVKLHLQMFKNAEVERQGVKKNGCVFDIDAYAKNYNEPDSSIFPAIDHLHEEQKTLFFSLLKPSFLSKLNPKY